MPEKLLHLFEIRRFDFRDIIPVSHLRGMSDETEAVFVQSKAIFHTTAVMDSLLGPLREYNVGVSNIFLTSDWVNGDENLKRFLFLVCFLPLQICHMGFDIHDYLNQSENPVT